MNRQPHRRSTNQTPLPYRLTDEQLRLLAKSSPASDPPKKGRSQSEFFVLGGLVFLQLIAAVVIITILRPFDSQAGKGEIASFDAPASTADVRWVDAAPPTPASISAEPVAAEPPAEASPGVAAPPTAEPTAARPQPAPAPLKIRGLEITQGIQVFNEPENPACDSDPNRPNHIFCNNGVPLVAGRHTLLRLYLACEGVCPAADVEVRLRLTKAGQEPLVLTERFPAARLPQVSRLSLDEIRLDLDHSLNFKLFPPPAWLVGPITIEVEAVTQAPPETPATLSLTKNFVPRKPLRVAYLPIQYQNVLPAALPNTDHWLLRLYPVPAVEYYRLPVPDLVWDRDLNKGELLNELLYNYLLFTQHNPPETWPDQIFGWLPQEFYNGGAADPAWCGNCAGTQSGRVAFGGVRPELDIGGPRILAHEIAHNLGAQHAWSPTARQDSACFKAEGADIQVDANWPYAESPHIQEVGVDVYSDPPVIYAPTYYDLMSYCNQPWISPHTYRTLFNSPILQPDNGAVASASFKPAGEALLISGLVYPDGRVTRPEVSRLEQGLTPAYGRFTTPGDDYCLSLRDREGRRLARRCFEAGFLNVETGLPTAVSPYFLTFPAVEINDIAHISLTQDDVELVTLTPSPTPPDIRLMPPTGGATLRGQATITWSGQDADGDSLTYDLLYSPDAGHSWLPLATRLTGTSYTFRADHLPASAQALLRLTANDGFHTTVVETETFLSVGE